MPPETSGHTDVSDLVRSPELPRRDFLKLGISSFVALACKSAVRPREGVLDPAKVREIAGDINVRTEKYKFFDYSNRHGLAWILNPNGTVGFAFQEELTAHVSQLYGFPKEEIEIDSRSYGEDQVVIYVKRVLPGSDGSMISLGNVDISLSSHSFGRDSVKSSFSDVIQGGKNLMVAEKAHFFSNSGGSNHSLAIEESRFSPDRNIQPLTRRTLDWESRKLSNGSRDETMNKYDYYPAAVIGVSDGKRMEQTISGFSYRHGQPHSAFFIPPNRPREDFYLKEEE